MSKTIKVIYIVGTSRCGSTILGNILGQTENMFFAGELRYLWDRGILENWLCGCGVPFSDCSVWKEIITKAFGYVDTREARKILASSERSPTKRKQSWLRTRYRLLLPAKFIQARLADKMADYALLLSKLYHAVHAASGKEVIVDSSKDPDYGLILRNVPNIDSYFVHLVRDPRAVTFSQTMRKKYQIVGPGRLELMGYGTPTLKSCLNWNKVNFFAAKLLNDNSDRYLLIRFEDFVKNPRRTVEDILSFVGMKAPDLSFMGMKEVFLEPNHAFSANPNRFFTGIVKIGQDEEWKDRIKPFKKVLLALLCLPGSVKWRYVVK